VTDACRFTPKKSEKPLTQFNEFNFKSKQPPAAGRLPPHRGGRVPHRTLPQDPNQHGMVLRNTQKSAYRPSRTMPRPFNLSKPRGAAAEAGAAPREEHVSQAQRVNSVFGDGRSTSKVATTSTRATHPQSPQLRTRLRAKTPATPSELREAKYVLKAAGSFKARPVSKKVLQSAGDLGVPRVDVPKPTEAAPFRICSKPDPMEARRRVAEMAAADEAAQRKFTANPVPSQLVGAGIPVVHPKASTQAVPFALTGSERHIAAQKEQMDRQLQAELEREAATLFRAAKPSSALSNPYVQAHSPRHPLHRLPRTVINSSRGGSCLFVPPLCRVTLFRLLCSALTTHSGSIHSLVVGTCRSSSQSPRRPSSPSG
jgi:hypothetical protein